MHFRTHVKEELRGISGQDEYADGMVEHDMHIGKFLDLLDELGIADNTFVYYSTDNGPHMNTWPDAAMTPFQGEKNTNWEGGWRVPAMVRWPDQIEAGSVSNGIIHHMDFLPTFLAAAGNPDIKEQLMKGTRAIGRKYKVHLDGYNLLPMLTGQTKESPRQEIFYFTDDGDQAMDIYQIALTVAEKLKLDTFIASVYLAMAQRQQEFEESSKALEYATMANAAAQNISSEELKQEVQEFLSTLTNG